MKKTKYTPEKLAGLMNNKASKSVVKDMNSAILLNPKQINIVISVLSYYDRTYFHQHKYSWIWFYKMAIDADYATVELEHGDVMMIVHAIEDLGQTKEQFELLRDIMQWYGIKRESGSLPYSPLPEDNRAGVYDDAYDGSQWFEFVDQSNPYAEKYLEEQVESKEWDNIMCTA